MNKFVLTLVLVFSLSLFHKVFAEQLLQAKGNETSELTANKQSLDSYGRSNPRGTVNGFFKALRNSDYLRAAAYIDFSNLVEKDNDSIMVSLVQKIETTLNKHGVVLPFSVINAKTEGDMNDGLSASFENVGSLDLNDKIVPIFLEQVSDDAGSTYWVISSETSDKLVEFIDSKSNEYLHETTNTSFKLSRWKGAPILDWLAIIFLALASYFVAWLFTLVIGWLVRLFWKNFMESTYSNFLRTLLIPLRLVLAVAILLNISRFIGVSIVVRQAFGVVNLIAMWTALFIFIWLLIDTFSSLGEERLRERNIFGGLSAISFIKNSAKFTLIVVAILMAFETLGFNVTAGIAALGVGGIALALGAQKTVENIVGGLSVVFDQPVSVGDFCKFGDTIGTVEKIGMRSTRIRTLGRTIVTIPNADFSSQLIENYAKRDMFLFLTTLGLRYETSSDQMRYILVELRKILYAHPKVNPEPARVRFLGYGSDSLKVEIFAYVHAVDWNDFLGVQEDINLRIAKVIEDSGSGFAFPSQTVYISQDQGLSETKKAEAEAKVKEWMENNELQIPNFDSATIESLKNSLEYPYNHKPKS